MSNSRELWVAKLFSAVLLLAMAINFGLQKKLWPLEIWEMYSQECVELPASVSQWRVVATDSDAQTHTIVDYQWMTVDDVNSEQPGHWFIHGAVEQESYKYLFVQTKAIIGKPVMHIEVWKDTWSTDFSAFPPITQESPTRSEKIYAY